LNTNDPLPKRWAWLYRGFRKYVLRYLRKHFHAVRLSKGSAALPNDGLPVLVVLNHPSWWDPMVGIPLSDLFTDFTHFAAIDASMLRKYRVFARLGFFGIDMKSLSGARTFLRTGSAILSHDHHAVWVTAQGQFADVRKRPLGLKPGVGHLAARLKKGWIVPIAIEYAFWNERRPEALARIGEPISLAGRSSDERCEDPSLARPANKEWTLLIEARLTETLDALNAEVMTRDPAHFTPLVGGELS
jgi:1-acyl-sn-glycerol-3-phosphate acyltransferase